MRTAAPASRAWPLLPNSALLPQRAIRLVVHGRAGGEVPEALRGLCQSEQSARRAPVELEVLTGTSFPSRSDGPLWLVPMLLWPGAHARVDVPMIRRRLVREGQSLTLLPFLGAWTSWWSLVAQALQVHASTTGVLIHHPLRPGLADRFLAQLSVRMGRPLVPFDQWPEYQRLHPEAQPLTLALAPNRMTESLGEAGEWPPLLDHPLIRQGLIDLLVSLP
ncbi:Conserved hypothetical protein [Synechococcus sp. WH 7803]|nr:Conserved hypothetical protein [Synechococcus sp. WH 7803]